MAHKQPDSSTPWGGAREGIWKGATLGSICMSFDWPRRATAINGLLNEPAARFQLAAGETGALPIRRETDGLVIRSSGADADSPDSVVVAGYADAQIGSLHQPGGILRS